VKCSQLQTVKGLSVSAKAKAERLFHFMTCQVRDLNF